MLCFGVVELVPLELSGYRAVENRLFRSTEGNTQGISLPQKDFAPLLQVTPNSITRWIRRKGYKKASLYRVL